MVRILILVQKGTLVCGQKLSLIVVQWRVFPLKSDKKRPSISLLHISKNKSYSLFLYSSLEVEKKVKLNSEQGQSTINNWGYVKRVRKRKYYIWKVYRNSWLDFTWLREIQQTSFRFTLLDLTCLSWLGVYCLPVCHFKHLSISLEL